MAARNTGNTGNTGNTSMCNARFNVSEYGCLYMSPLWYTDDLFRVGQSQLGLATALCDLLKNMWLQWRNLHIVCPQNKTCVHQSSICFYLSVVMKLLFRHFTEYLHKYPQLCKFSVIKCVKTQDGVFLTSCCAPERKIFCFFECSFLAIIF